MSHDKITLGSDIAAKLTLIGPLYNLCTTTFFVVSLYHGGGTATAGVKLFVLVVFLSLS